MIEIVFALVFFASVALVSAKFAWQVIRWQQEGKRYMKASMLARDRIEQILKSKKIPITAKNESYGEFNVVVKAKPFQLKSVNLPQGFSQHFKKRIFNIEVAVSWLLFGGAKKTVNFETCMVQRRKKKGKNEQDAV